MSKRVLSTLVLLAVSFVPLTATAQEDEMPYVYASYLYCNASDQWMADAIVENAYAPVYDAAVEDGSIIAWGWMAHHTGGKWRRLLYRVAPTMDAALDATEALAEKIGSESSQAASQVARICPEHEDYIWQRIAGSGQVGEERGAAGFSAYWMCDAAKEERADEIVKEVLAPLYNKQVADGKLDTWGWMGHVVGGKWRRISTMSGKDHKTLMAARAAVISELREKHEAAMTEFNDICGSHSDYLWNIQLETP